MILISKEEAKSVREKFPDIHIRRTTNKYYMSENWKAVEYLRILHGQEREARYGGQHKSM